MTGRMKAIALAGAATELLAHPLLGIGFLPLAFKGGPLQRRDAEVLRPLLLSQVLLLDHGRHTFREAVVADHHVHAGGAPIG